MPKQTQANVQYQAPEQGSGKPGIIGTMGSVAEMFGAPAPLLAGLGILGGQNPVEALAGMFMDNQKGPNIGGVPGANAAMGGPEDLSTMPPMFLQPADGTQAFAPNAVQVGGMHPYDPMNVNPTTATSAIMHDNLIPQNWRY